MKLHYNYKCIRFMSSLFISTMAALILLVLYVVSLVAPMHGSHEERKVYIVYMGVHCEGDYYKLQEQHMFMLQQIVDESFVSIALVRSYYRSFNGFAAFLTSQEQRHLANFEEVVSIFPSKTLWPQTTRSWDYIGMSIDVERNPATESDTIIGVIDSGVWPESESFSDEGFDPIPERWEGVCDGGENFTCNKKLIGARYYTSGMPSLDSPSARDTIGHGSHTASTAAGNYVEGASFYSIAQGTARGGVPSARIATYKVCYTTGCREADILAAFDDAIADGVDIITISIGSSTPVDMSIDSISIGSLHAMQKGILTVHAAGNNGFKARTVSSVAPWLLTVGASSIDRGIITKIVLGNGVEIDGKSVNSFRMNVTDSPLVHGKDASSKCGEKSAERCSQGCLDSSLVTGKTVLCDSSEGINEALNAGASGVIADSGKTPDISLVVPLPASSLATKNLKLIHDYIHSTKDAKAFIWTSEIVKNMDAPLVASFSSKGPNPIIRDILKPDITAPGVEILAAYSPEAPISSYASDRSSSVKYNILSGTSMSTPHAAGAAAYVKSAHPDWSPSAIKSTIMTTAWRLDPGKHNDAEFSYGAGHINPVDATNPGLVYETSSHDYIKMLCKIGYSSEIVEKLFQDKSINCSEFQQFVVTDLNYPSMTKEAKRGAPLSAIFSRTVTNIGPPNSTYKAMTIKSPDCNVTVRPDIRVFGAVNEKKSFEVIISGNVIDYLSASLEWSDGVHKVRSPIVVYSDKRGLAPPSILYYALLCLHVYVYLLVSSL